MGEFLGHVVFSILAAAPAMIIYGIAFSFRKFNKKSWKRFTIIIAIANCILVYFTILDSESVSEDPEFFGKWWHYVILFIVCCIASRVILFNEFKPIICPHCGEWNEYKHVGILYSDEMGGWETRARDIHDNAGKKIGTYDNREYHEYRYTRKQLECTACGKKFAITFKSEIS